MKIKICGLNPTRDVQLCINLKVDYLGFVFYEKSPRNISLQDIAIYRDDTEDFEIIQKYKRSKNLFKTS